MLEVHPGILKAIESIDRRTWRLGLYRYDPTDILSHPVFMATQRGCLRPVWKLLRTAELIAPLTLRRALKVRKSLAPTTLWHLVRSYLNLISAGHGLKFDAPARVETLCACALSISEAGPHLCWTHPYKIHGAQWRQKSPARALSVPASCAHNTARLGLALLDAGRTFNNTTWSDAGMSAARALRSYHNWFWSADRRECAVSYYPDTPDEVINTGAEVAVLFAEAAGRSKDGTLAEHAGGLLRMLLAEQERDGGWRYCTRAHERKMGPSMGPDNHHHAMVIRALSRAVSRHPSMLDDLPAARRAVVAGVMYYLRELSDQTGFCYLFGGQKREAGIAGYCEGLLALQEAHSLLRNEAPDIAGLVADRRREIVARISERYVDAESGRVVSQRRFGAQYDIDSIRWGSGLVLEAFTAELCLADGEGRSGGAAG